MFTYKVAQPFQVSHFCYDGARIVDKVHSLFQKVLGIGCLKSLLMLALLKRFPYTVP
jgi:hypothetical protein